MLRLLKIEASQRHISRISSKQHDWIVYKSLFNQKHEVDLEMW